MDFIQALHDWGWAGVLILFLVKDIWPFIREKLFPAYIEEKKRRDEAAATERQRLKNLEDRQVAAFDKIADAVVSIERIIAVNSERLGQIQGDVDVLLKKPQPKTR